ncbi:MAG: carboxypeptidase regulatory-like domain-containing protein [Terracidiphilus sp.]
MRAARGVVPAAAALMMITPFAIAQNNAPSGTGGIHGQVADVTGAVIPNATVVATTTSGQEAGKATSNGVGQYTMRGLAPGTYSITVTASGFSAFAKPGAVVAAGQMLTVNAAMQIEVQQQVEVQSEANTVSTSPEDNANAVVIKGEDLNALSDDPDELQNELEALAGPAAGPNGGQIYIDGFTGGQLPPKSSIREIRVNQNPFSAEYDRLGYGRIEIFTKPGTGTIHGELQAQGNDSVFNSQNPLLVGVAEPPYYSWNLHGSIGGPITKSSSYFVSAFSRQQQNENIVEAINPASITAASPDGTSINEAFGSPTSRLDISPRFDLQLGSANTLTIRETYNRSVSTDSIGSNGLTLPEQATNSTNQENTVQISDSWVLSKNLVDDVRFQYRRVRDMSSAVSDLPAFSIQGLFSDGGNSDQMVQDHENDLELQNYLSGVEGAHSLNFGARLRAYPDINFTTSGSNGAYTFAQSQDFLGCYQTPQGSTPPASCQPQQYTYTNITNPKASATLFDAALFYQDDWKVNSRFTFSYGLRWETQNWINDKDDWAPRLSLAYALDRGAGKRQAKTVLRAGYGWFYQRFTVANGFGASAPYVVNTIHENGVNEQQFIQTSSQTSPIVFNQYATTPLSASTSGSTTGKNAPTFYTIAPNFHAANDMEAAIGVDRQVTKAITGNVTYVYSQGIHQFFTDNLSAAAEFPPENALSDTYPATAPGAPPTNNLQYQSGGFYRESQIMATVRATYRRYSFVSNYTYSNAQGDTSGVGSVPSVSSDPGVDFGRTTFDVRNRFMLFGNFSLPWAVSFSPMIVANSGTPFNITAGSDLTGNNQFNSRPTIAASCSEPNAFSTRWGCFDTEPYGTANPTAGTAIEPYAANEKIASYGLGSGPANISLNLRLSKVIGIGPAIEGEGGSGGGGGGGRGGGYHGGGRGMPPGLNGGLSGNQGGPGRMNQSVARKYSLTLSAWGTNIFNHENLGTPNGVLSLVPDSTGALAPQPNFGRSQTLAGGFFASPTAGNRNISLQAIFSF